MKATFLPGCLGFLAPRRRAVPAPPAAAPANISPPQILGTPEVGQTLTATAGLWTGSPTGFSRQWYRDGVAIGGEIALSYTLTPEDVGSPISIGEIASNAIGPSAEAFSDPAGPVTDTTVPTITSANPSGSYEEGVAIGGTLTASEDVTWSKLGTDAAAVTLDADTGLWSLEETVFATQSSYSWTFRATDGGGNTADQIVSIAITAVGEPPTLAAPVLSDAAGWTTGDNPPLWSSFYPGTVAYNAGTGEGSQVRARWRMDGGAWTTEAWEGLDDELLTGELTWPLLEAADLSAGGFFEVQEQHVIDLGLGSEVMSDWSNVWDDELGEPAGETATEWTSATGVNKSQYVTVAGAGNLVFTGPGGGFNNAPCSVRATQARSGKRQFQVTVGANVSAYFHIGVDDGTDNFQDAGTTMFSRPGKDNPSGVSLKINEFDWAIAAGGGNVQTGSRAVSIGDLFAVEFDTEAGTVSFFHKNGGSWAQIGTAVTGLSFSSLYANVGAENNHTLTALFGSGQDRPLSSGYSPYDA